MLDSSLRDEERGEKMLADIDLVEMRYVFRVSWEIVLLPGLCRKNLYEGALIGGVMAERTVAAKGALSGQV